VAAAIGCQGPQGSNLHGAAGEAGAGGGAPDAAAAGSGGGTTGTSLCGGGGSPNCASDYQRFAGATFCPLSAGIASLCSKCGVSGGAFSCSNTSLYEGAKYTYLAITNVDVEWVFVYDRSGTLVANLLQDVGGRWSCNGSADIDLGEVGMALSTGAYDALVARCAGVSADASADGRD
jgi:hypothetical protein